MSASIDKFKVVLGDDTVAANGAVITLAEGQTQVSFALVQEGEVTANASLQLSATLSGSSGAATSNAWGVNLQDTGVATQTYTGDQRAKLRGTETQISVPSSDPTYNTYAWNETSWATNGTLNGGVAQAGFADVIDAGTGNDIVNGLDGNDALGGNAGADQIDGGSGDDLIAGGTGSDRILGGSGHDFITSSGSFSVNQRQKPSDSWSPPSGEQVLAQGPGWGIYQATVAGAGPANVWIGAGSLSGTEGDYVDGGTGNDDIVGSGGADRLLGGLDNDKLDGMGGDDVLEGGEGNDFIQADGIIQAGRMNTVAGQDNGADFVDGGIGNDILIGGGRNDVVYGGANDDQMWGDAQGKTGDADVLELGLHGSDYMDGEDGDDLLAFKQREWQLRGFGCSQIRLSNSCRPNMKTLAPPIRINMLSLARTNGATKVLPSTSMEINHDYC